MRQRKWIFWLVLIFMMAWSPVSAEIYQWMDKDGVTHASSDPEKMPPAYRGRAQVISAAEARSEAVEEYAIPFEKGPSGVIMVQVFINDVIRAKMVFDTGASLVLISDELARRLDQTEAADAGEKIRLKTAGGDVEGRPLLIKKMDLSNAVKENVRAAVSHRKQVFDDFDGLLGLSFLEGFKVTIDHQNREIILRRQ
jgi:clan AA aspartic protease (TIGR02281 family)